MRMGKGVRCEGNGQGCQHLLLITVFSFGS